MPRTSTLPPLQLGRVYRTRDLARWGANSARLARRLVEQGALERLAHGLYVRPRPSRFGRVPPTDEELLRSFLGNTEFVVTGPERWNTLGLGATASFAATLVYNRKRTGTFHLGGRPFHLRRVAFPRNPPPEWFAVDLLTHADEAGVARGDVVHRMRTAVGSGRLDSGALRDMADRYATRAVCALLESALVASAT